VPRRAHLGLALFALAAAACGGAPDTPEAQVRGVLGRLEAAAEEGDLAAFREHVSERFADDAGNDKASLLQLVAFHALRHRGRHVVTRVRAVDLRAPARAEVTLAVGLAGRAAAGAGALHADVWRVQADLEREPDGAWRVTWAYWKPGEPADLL
jgi:hypothetical protein